ncbi:ABC transporter permease [Corynebacterium sp.]|uniref:ABC transporter permease n=1 Tax=Corynebacterium sp. TaxID=1720 RepID=UPI0026DD9485|nr:FtsX-like permease family protein [Corynebacterium sp.]MDO5076963.1 FtsX-like permease family protein [Corynebacterium sp.]
MFVRKPFLNALRQMRLQVGSLLGLVIIIGVAVGFYATLKTNSVNFERSTYQYFHDYGMPDLIVDGVGFTDQDADTLRRMSGVEAVQVRASVDTRDGDDTLRLLSYDIHNPRVNRPYLQEGREPEHVDECLVAEKYATKNDVHPGDTVRFEHRLFQAECKVSGIATAPEDMYLKQSATESVADTSEFGVVYVDTEFLRERQVPANQIVLVFAQDADGGRINEDVETALGEKVEKLTEKTKVGSYDSFSADVGDYNRMAYIFPIVFLIIASVVVFVGQRRNVMRDRRQIGILKAMGCSSGLVITLYCLISAVATIVGAGLGALIAWFAGPFLVNTYQSIFTAPYFTFQGFGEHLWLPVALSLLVTVIATLFAVWRVVTIMPAEAMHAEPPKTGRDVLLQRTPLWGWLSFHSRYSLKAALRNRGRFFAMVCGVVASVTLTVLSLGFQDSYKFVTTDYFDTVVDYDLAIRTSVTPRTQPPSIIDAAPITEHHEALVLAGTFSAGDRSEELPLVILDNPDDVYNFESAAGGAPSYSGGIVLPEYYAELLGVSVGDTVKVSTPNDVVAGEATVVACVRQNIGFLASATTDTAQHSLGLADSVYNTVFASTDADVRETQKTLERQDGVLAVNSVSDDRKSFQTLSATLSMYIVLLVCFSVVLGIAALYSVSTIALLARQYEFVLLRVMGYSPREISFAYLKELALQFVFGLPLGLVCGYYLTSYVARKFANSQLLFEAHIQWDTYAWAACSALGVIVFVWLVSLRKIARLHLVEGVKVRDE